MKTKRYDWTRSYEWNYQHAPNQIDTSLQSDGECGKVPEPLDVPIVPGTWDFLGLPVASPLGVAAGPLLNGGWCLHYADLGFDVLTYKTVRSGLRACYPMPNLQPVTCDPMTGSEDRVAPCETMHGSWAVSFGMPSSEPDHWRRDVEQTRKSLATDKILSVSVVGTIAPGWDLERLAQDYATCARWAVDSGADCVEANFSCPNVTTCDGQLYQNADQSRLVAQAIRDAVGQTPLIVKIGFVPSIIDPEPLVLALNDIVNALSMTNSIASKVGHHDDDLMFDQQQRGICGDAIRESSINQVERFSNVISRCQSSLRVIGVGGIRSADHVRSYLEAGAVACHLATAVMTDPTVGIEIRKNMT